MSWNWMEKEILRMAGSPYDITPALALVPKVR
jgi:hypothetical protein